VRLPRRAHHHITSASKAREDLPENGWKA